jgi:hypothetical protein
MRKPGISSLTFIAISIALVMIAGCSARDKGRDAKTASSQTAETSESIVSVESTPTPIAMPAEPAESAEIAEPEVSHASSTSPDGKYLIEAYGENKNITAGGYYASEGIRLLDTVTGQVLWSMMPGYYTQDFLWSPDGRHVAVSYMARIWGGTLVVDAQDGSEIILPGLEEVRKQWDGETTINENRADPYFQTTEWVDSSKLNVRFEWTGTNDAYIGNYEYDFESGKLIVTPETR